MLVTDGWRSSISAFAQVVLSAPVEVSSPVNTMVPALGPTEALIAAATARLVEHLDGRLQEVEGMRSRHRGALDGGS